MRKTLHLVGMNWVCQLLLDLVKGLETSHHKLYVGNWASEASPTLGCSIEISRDIYMYVYMLSVCRSMSVVCQINCVGGITYGPRACSKSFFLAVKPVTPGLPCYSFPIR